ncbi:MAG: iron-containing alcohol dehydrogenase, partial [Methanomicrobiales archaeon]|nr:iron-containing alcohol dehydrogenase [Methanomicrobiales archaeon]
MYEADSMDEDLGRNSFEFHLRTNLVFGAGSALSLAKHLREMPKRRIGFIVDPAIVSSEYVQQILAGFSDEPFEDIRVWVYDIRGEPDYDSLDRVIGIFRDHGGVTKVDCFVGIGGGSVIDFAKGLATLATNPGHAIQYRGFPSGLHPSLPVIAIPTTAGTGSEVTYNAVFIDRSEKRKLGINTLHNFPALAILDPNLITTCPPPVLVSSGIDSLVHAVESFAAKRSNPLTRIFAREALSRTYPALSRILDEQGDPTLLSNLQLGAYLAGISLMNSGSGPAGALSYPLGVHFRVPHGLAGGIFLPPLVGHNVAKGFDYSDLYDTICE